MSSSARSRHRLSVGGYHLRSVDANGVVLGQFPITGRTMMVRFRYSTRQSRVDPTDGRVHRGGRVAVVLLNAPSTVPIENRGSRQQWVDTEVRDILENEYQHVLGIGWSGENNEDAPYLDAQTGAEYRVLEIKSVVDDAALRAQLGDQSRPSAREEMRMYGPRPYVGYQPGHDPVHDPSHQSFRYMVRGIEQLKALIPDLVNDPNHRDCGSMCAYLMLEKCHYRSTTNCVPKNFRKDNVFQYLNTYGPRKGNMISVKHGLTPEDIQFHAQKFNYAHCALDLNANILLYHRPETRNHNHSTTCYYVIGDHCEPVVDTEVIKSIMQHVVRKDDHQDGIACKQSQKSIHTSWDRHIAMPFRSALPHHNSTNAPRKRPRSLDPVFRPQFPKSQERTLQEQWAPESDTIESEVPEAPPLHRYTAQVNTGSFLHNDLELDDWADDVVDESRATGTPVATVQPSQLGEEGEAEEETSAAETGRGRGIQLPLVTDTDRFHRFTVADNLEDVVAARCRPDYREGIDPQLIHYYICTDSDDVEFLYNYLIRVLKIDPLRYARSFNGHCRQIRMQNVWWFACRDIDCMLDLHAALYPLEPFRMSSLATYGFRMLHHEMYKVATRDRAGALWSCLSHYSPNLQRFLDTTHPYNRVKILNQTYQAPYSKPDPRHPEKTQTLIPMSQRRRIDLIRSYAATIHGMRETAADSTEQGDQYPIHDPTDRMVPFDPAVHGHIPIGHYLVHIPTTEQMQSRSVADDWKRLPCLHPGHRRMMSHRMVRDLLDRRLLTRDDIELACPTNAARQGEYGPLLTAALKNLLYRVYHLAETTTVSPDTQRAVGKHLINHLIGLCNGTSMQRSGSRYVFDDLTHLLRILATTVSTDTLCRMKVFKVDGYDPLWKTSYEYYEMDASGLSYRPLHFQPIFNTVLEIQAMRMFDLSRRIPLGALIQISVDAIEYRVEDRATAPWARALETETVTREVYDGLTHAQMMDQGYLGRFKTEMPKDESRAMMYHYEYNRLPHANSQLNRFYCGSLDTPAPPHPMERNLHDLSRNPQQDTERQDYIESWHQAMDIQRLQEPEATETFMKTQVMERLFAHLERPLPPPQPEDLLLTEEERTEAMDETALGPTNVATNPDMAGIIVTGPAGTGKTFWIRWLYNQALQYKQTVVMTAYTHAACIQMGHEARTLCSLFGIDETTNVRFTVGMSRRFNMALRNFRIDMLIIDEISLIPLDLLEILMLFHRVHPRTRICCFGDFNQLTPVEIVSERRFQRPADFTYFEHTDIFPYLVYDRVRNQPGQWIQLNACMRTQDPLLVRICQDPKYAPTIEPRQFPPPPEGTPVWRFLCATNHLRKAVNFYCMYRFLAAHPQAVRYHFNHRDLYVEQKLQETQRRTPTTTSSSTTTSTTPTTTRFTREYFERQYDALWEDDRKVPSIWRTIQDFTFAEGMDVVCRKTMRQWKQDVKAEDQPQNAVICVNNRRARIVTLDLKNRRVTLRWWDFIRRRELRRQQLRDEHPTLDTDAEIDRLLDLPVDSEDVTLTFHDFAFHFCPGFCLTAHTSQGETIREHYTIMGWPSVRQDARMAYVMVTRGSTSEYLHIAPSWWSDPWNEWPHTRDLRHNVLVKLYNRYANDRDKTVVHWTVEEALQFIQSRGPTPTCMTCQKTLLMEGYDIFHPMHKDNHFMFTTDSPKIRLTSATARLVCNHCFLAQRAK